MNELFDKEKMIEILNEIYNFFYNIVNNPLDYSFTN